jgi:hypothetical protein
LRQYPSRKPWWSSNSSHNSLRRAPSATRTSSECPCFLAGRREIGRFDCSGNEKKLFEGHVQLAKAALTENEGVVFEHFVADAQGHLGGVDAPGNARGSRTETTVAGTRRGRGDDPIALNDADREALV